MNERIKELAEQAEEYTGLKHNNAYWRLLDDMQEDLTWREKFAELIVRECAQAFEAEVDTWKQMDPYQGSIKRQGAKEIKEHFGVEE